MNKKKIIIGARGSKLAIKYAELAIREMVKLKGVGRWTAEVYLLFALRRPDIWPADDLGIITRPAARQARWLCAF